MMHLKYFEQYIRDVKAVIFCTGFTGTARAKKFYGKFEQLDKLILYKHILSNKKGF